MQLTRKEAAAHFGVSVDTIDRRTEAGVFKHVANRGRTKVLEVPDDLAADGQRLGPPGSALQPPGAGRAPLPISTPTPVLLTELAALRAELAALRDEVRERRAAETRLQDLLAAALAKVPDAEGRRRS